MLRNAWLKGYRRSFSTRTHTLHALGSNYEVHCRWSFSSSMKSSRSIALAMTIYLRESASSRLAKARSLSMDFSAKNSSIMLS